MVELLSMPNTPREKWDKRGKSISTWCMYFPFVVLDAVYEANLNFYYDDVTTINNPWKSKD